jgi:hypothetical protein
VALAIRQPTQAQNLLPPFAKRPVECQRNAQTIRTMHLEVYSCVFCTSQEDETVEHFFMACPFAQLCWNSIGFQIQTDLGPSALLEDLRRQIAAPFFMEVITLMSWSI